MAAAKRQKTNGEKRKRLITYKLPNDHDFEMHNVSFFYDIFQLHPTLYDNVMETLLKVPFTRVCYQKYGRLCRTPRQTFVYGFNESKIVRYRGKEFTVRALPDIFQQLKELVEKITGFNYNAMLINRYENNDDHISWHADDEKFLLHKNIASLTFGFSRRFIWKNISQTEKYEIYPESGSLLSFSRVQHCLPKMMKKEKANADQNDIVRYNITFRCANDIGIGNYYYYNQG